MSVAESALKPTTRLRMSIKTNHKTPPIQKVPKKIKMPRHLDGEVPKTKRRKA